MLKQSQQWSHRTVDVSPSEEAHRLTTGAMRILMLAVLGMVVPPFVLL